MGDRGAHYLAIFAEFGVSKCNKFIPYFYQFFCALCKVILIKLVTLSSFFLVLMSRWVMNWKCIFTSPSKRNWCWVKFSADDILRDIYFFEVFTRKQALTFHDLTFLTRRQFAWNVKAYFLRKNKKISICRLLNLPKSHALFTFDLRWAYGARITKTHLFKNIENFTSKNWKFSDKNLWYFSCFCSKHRLWVHVRTASTRRF